ncbi:uncharacterized protein SAMN05421830_101755 [Desulfomicrobium norvegicum]|uniref:Asparagine synthetase domain-containing protein n=1 Tax=Desulfomicrobium norvegicum (strain DSM 1741 / NCIMB 8310) TaxID=52561 RepID=A0A8G2C0L3_DESNO|nr:hypothetical protein [Desulfomicrobium norvegicum]SFL35458.1 uncharacterized protein SAMN05421830_101755 [Desulfomicrobium norvegicum]
MPLHDETSAWDSLIGRLREVGPVTVAFSGGIDSRFLAHAGLLAGVSVELVHVRGPHVAPEESEYALAWAASMGLPWKLLRLDPLHLPEVAAGSKARCYECKRFLFEQILSVATAPVCDGSNASDARQFRPGRRALLELGIRSPLAEVGLTKDMIRALARKTGLARPEQQARACLLTRLPYGLAPDARLLARLAAGERAVEEALQAAGHEEFPFRLRLGDRGCHELHLGREIHSSRMLCMLEEVLLAEGFSRIAVRCVSQLSGYFDRMDDEQKTQSFLAEGRAGMLESAQDD